MKYVALNYQIQSDIAAEYAQFLTQEFVEVMRQRGHSVQIVNDEIMLEVV